MTEGFAVHDQGRSAKEPPALSIVYKPAQKIKNLTHSSLPCRPVPPTPRARALRRRPQPLPHRPRPCPGRSRPRRPRPRLGRARPDPASATPAPSRPGRSLPHQLDPASATPAPVPPRPGRARPRPSRPRPPLLPDRAHASPGRSRPCLGALVRHYFPGIVTHVGKDEPTYMWAHYESATMPPQATWQLSSFRSFG
ncbi:hypothetical protein BDA96_10G203500 [Sorghum bicolor]|uniref:Uncharacterized protein n=1 Tax=Sorghum bicolor TaxID=4558 RepID=A0A921Q5J4_SORBI|nr:hypothetical protein BDA96_10G203500 [Sorghum bicolor]